MFSAGFLHLKNKKNMLRVEFGSSPILGFGKKEFIHRFTEIITIKIMD